MFYEINRAYLPLSNGTKGHGKTNKGNSRRTFCSQGLRHASRTRARKNILKRSQRRCACLCVCVCVSKISETAKYKALKYARKLLFLRTPLLLPLIFAFVIIMHCQP